MNYQVCKVIIDPFDSIILKIKYSYNDENNNIKLSILDTMSEMNNTISRNNDNLSISSISDDNLKINHQFDNQDDECVKLSILVVYDQINLNPEINGVVLTNILLLNNKIPYFIVKKTEDFKYKKEIRKILETTYQLKSNDILSIKHINNNIYHNYMVILKTRNKAKIQYNYCIRSKSSTEFLWKTIYSIVYKNDYIDGTGVYQYLYKYYINQSRLNESFLIDLNSSLNLSDIFQTLHQFTNK